MAQTPLEVVPHARSKHQLNGEPPVDDVTRCCRPPIIPKAACKARVLALLVTPIARADYPPAVPANQRACRTLRTLGLSFPQGMTARERWQEGDAASTRRCSAGRARVRAMMKVLRTFLSRVFTEVQLRRRGTAREPLGPSTSARRVRALSACRAGRPPPPRHEAAYELRIDDYFAGRDASNVWSECRKRWTHGVEGGGRRG